MGSTVLFLLLLPFFISPSSSVSFSPHNRCESISIPMCSGIAYNQTIFPNLMGQLTQDAAGQHMSQFVPLIKINCSAHIHFFLCTMYAPVCTILDHALPPCRALCQAARKGCEEVMLQFDFPWPAEFDCNKFPIGGKPDELCVGDTDSQMVGVSDERLERYRTSSPPPGPSTGRRPGDYSQMMNFRCPVQLQMPPELEYRLLIGRDQVVEDCGAPCYHNITFFDREQIRFSHAWVFSWSLICLLSCLFTLATFVIERSRFPYPERPIVYLALCYCAIAVVFVIGFGHGEDISCNQATVNRSMNYLTERTIKQVRITLST